MGKLCALNYNAEVSCRLLKLLFPILAIAAKSHHDLSAFHQQPLLCRQDPSIAGINWQGEAWEVWASEFCGSQIIVSPVRHFYCVLPLLSTF